jgi:hypothetical protein
MEYRRYPQASGLVEYEILSSKKKCWYSVILLSGLSISCECQSWHFNHSCKHGTFAEQKERELNPPVQPTKVEMAQLNNRNAGFNLLRK